MNDERFEPVLGRIRQRPSRAGRRYLGKVLAAVRLAGRSGAKRRFAGLSRIGRGSAAAGLLGHGKAGMRRAIVKTRLVRLAASGIGAARAHLRYIQRDGTQRDGSPGLLYSANEDDADGKSFLERCAGDRHQFRIIVSAEDASQYEDLKPLVRRFMDRMEKDLGTRLQWLAADHLDTGHPHSHIILRGMDERGENLIIARDYIGNGMRQRVAELVSLDLGPRSAIEIQEKMRLEVGAERLTGLDRALRRLAGEEGRLVPAGRTMAEHMIRLARLRKLETLGLAQRLEGGCWQLPDNLEASLRAMAERGDIIRTMQRALTRARLERASGDLIAYRGELAQPITGRLIERGLSDELNDQHYLILDGIDGRSYHVSAGSGASLGSLPEGAILSIAPGGPSAGRGIELLSALPLERLGHYDGATWLDHQLAESPLPVRGAGFGKEVRAALALRRAWLLERELAVEDLGSFSFKPGALDLLRRQDIESAGARLSAETGLLAARPMEGERIEGVLRRWIDLGSGRYAMIENGREFMLVPWRPMLERQLDRPVAGLIRGDQPIWQLGRLRGIER